MDLIVAMRFGSHLYGTATPQSDLDYKAVYLPEARDILVQRVQSTVSRSRADALFASIILNAITTGTIASVTGR
jgi:predicted nucleotidyltransferase